MTFATDAKAEVDPHKVYTSTNTTPMPFAVGTPAFLQTGHKALFTRATGSIAVSATCTLQADGTATPSGTGSHVVLASTTVGAGNGFWVRAGTR